MMFYETNITSFMNFYLDIKQSLSVLVVVLIEMLQKCKHSLKEELANEVVIAKFATTTQHGAIKKPVFRLSHLVVGIFCFLVNKEV